MHQVFTALLIGGPPRSDSWMVSRLELIDRRSVSSTSYRSAAPLAIVHSRTHWCRGGEGRRFLARWPIELTFVERERQPHKSLKCLFRLTDGPWIMNILVIGS